MIVIAAKANCADNRIMKQILLFVCLGITASAEIFHGTLLPQKCRNDDPATHTTECALKCADGGLGIALKGSGEYAAFAPASQARALTFLKSITRKADLRIEVTGKRSKSGAIEIETIALDED